MHKLKWKEKNDKKCKQIDKVRITPNLSNYAIQRVLQVQVHIFDRKENALQSTINKWKCTDTLRIVYCIRIVMCRLKQLLNAIKLHRKWSVNVNTRNI